MPRPLKGGGAASRRGHAADEADDGMLVKSRVWPPESDETALSRPL